MADQGGLKLKREPRKVLLSFFLAVMCAVTAVYADGLVINEFLAVNDSIRADEDGDYSDWIEIYNGFAVLIKSSVVCCSGDGCVV